MNIVEMELVSALVIEAKIIGHKRGIVLGQVDACERVLKYTSDRIDQIILEKEIADLKLMQDLIE
jgi:hypothetical protein